MAAAPQVIEVLARHHAAIADEHDAVEPEASLEIAHDIGDGPGIAPVALEHMMSDRPTVDQNQTHQHLPVARLAIAAVAIGAKLGRSLAFEIGRGQIVEHHVDPQREQVAQRQIKRVLDLRLALEQLIERAIPLLQLPRRYPHAWASAGLAFRVVAPRRDPTPAMTITDEIVLQPLRQRMLAAWARQAVGDQNQGALAERDAITASARAGCAST